MYKRREKELLAGLIEAAIEELEAENARLNAACDELQRAKDFIYSYGDSAILRDYLNYIKV